MLMPLAALAILATTRGAALEFRQRSAAATTSKQFLTPAALEAESDDAGTGGIELLLMAASTGAALAGLVVASCFTWQKPRIVRRELAEKTHAMYSIMLNKYYVDELYRRHHRLARRTHLARVPLESRRRGNYRWRSQWRRRILVRGTRRRVASHANWNVRTYAAWILLGGVVL